MSQLRVDLARMAELVERMGAVTDHLVRVRDDVAARSAGVEWTGAAAARHAAAMAQWSSGAAEVDAALAVVRRGLATAYGNYVAAVHANRRMWSR